MSKLFSGTVAKLSPFEELQKLLLLQISHVSKTLFFLWPSPIVTSLGLSEVLLLRFFNAGGFVSLWEALNSDFDDIVSCVYNLFEVFGDEILSFCKKLRIILFIMINKEFCATTIL